MDIATLKTRIAAYLQGVPGDFVVSGFDLILDAINKSHQWAQQQYDFELAKVSVDALVDLQNGVPVSPLPLHGTATMVPVKKVYNAFISDGYGGVRPIPFVDRDFQVQDSFQRWNGIPYPWAPAIRDLPTYPTFYQVYLVQMGGQLMIYPAAQVVVPQNPLPVYLDVWRYFPDYTNASPDNADFLLQFGDDWLGWNSICRLNYLRKEFVPRQEGNVAPPTEERDKAWQDLLAWDAQMVVTADTALNLD